MRRGTMSLAPLNVVRPFRGGGVLRPVFDVLDPGLADLRQVAVAAEVYNSASHRRSAEEVADLAMRPAGVAETAVEAEPLAQSVVEAMPVARPRRRRG